jgi:hypothetical protein
MELDVEKLKEAIRIWHNEIVKSEGVDFIDYIADEEIREILHCVIDEENEA